PTSSAYEPWWTGHPGGSTPAPAASRRGRSFGLRASDAGPGRDQPPAAPANRNPAFPPCFMRYIASSARETSEAAVSPGLPSAIPTLAVTVATPEANGIGLPTA